MFRLILHFPRFEPMPSDFAAKVTATTIGGHRWRKNIDKIDTDDRWTVRNIGYIDGH